MGNFLVLPKFLSVKFRVARVDHYMKCPHSLLSAKTQLLSSSIEAHFGLGYNVQDQLLVHNAGSCLREVSLVGHQTAPTETTRTAYLVHPLGPLGVELSVGLLVLGLEH